MNVSTKYLIISTFFGISTFYLNGQQLDSKLKSPIKKDSVHKKFSRPEERGLTFENETNEFLFDSLKQSDNLVQQKKVAKVLGDRYIQKKLNLTENQKNIIENFVISCLNNTKSEDSNIREEGKLQIERLWQLAAPTLLKYIDNDDAAKAEIAAKSLILMRNEEIIKAIIDQANKTTDKNKKKRYVFVLSKMQEQRTSAISGRKCINVEESNKLFNDLVLPAIDKLKK